MCLSSRLYHLSRAAVVLAAGLMLAACGHKNPYYDPDKQHHTENGFRNNYLDHKPGGLLKWQWERLVEGLPKAPSNDYKFPVVTSDAAWLQNNKTETTATWIGHSTVLVQLHGTNILTDPIWSERASPFSFAGPKRRVAPPIALADLPHIDVVLISHNHYDHLDKNTVRQLNKQAGGPPLFLVPLGIKPWMKEIGVDNAEELDWWDKTPVGALDFHFVPAQHWSARGMFDRMETLWGGWFVRTAADERAPFSFFFSGDTGFSKEFEAIAKRLGSVDLALIPIGAYEPRWFMQTQHVNPADAVKIHQTMGSRKSIAVHWGTFEMADESLDEPPLQLQRDMAQANLPLDSFVALKHGETMHLPATKSAK